MLTYQAELKDSVPDETFDVLRFPGVAEKQVDLLCVLLLSMPLMTSDSFF